MDIFVSRSSNKVLLVHICVVFLCFMASGNGWLFTSKKKVCYGSLGCFSAAKPFTNAGGQLPRAPDVISTRFFLFTRNNSDIPEELLLNDNIRKCGWKSFCESKDIRIIIHGYMDSIERPWVKKMARTLLKQGDYNVVIVDWRYGAREYNYLQSVANIRVVGAQVAQLLEIFKRLYDTDFGRVHIIGHSLGAHAAGYAGEYVEGIGRITGLDPAGPAFVDEDPEVRLDPMDALFVDAIHTDGEHLFSGGLGLMQPLGTVDFYPNGGRDMPGCPNTYFARMTELFTGNFDLVQNFACSHLRVLNYFTESITSKCRFTAHLCPNTTRLTSAECSKCGTDMPCGVMGYHTDVNMTSGIYLVSTNAKYPYCQG
ncbi:inactive pancreatic lipase-related protein 1-like [Mya arenaria]|uniref:inactive pancreatic lipase-related protein 1-like n=1 Tax=Mya arenaria TaxID=6604 RepID=UPI0022E791DF|nr:inactive pancreatic lipase-related protein 1-like [Mya arenaria]